MSPETEHRHEVRIHIDQQPYDSPNPTSGEALYVLAKVPFGLELFRELAGDREDPEVATFKERKRQMDEEFPE